MATDIPSNIDIKASQTASRFELAAIVAKLLFVLVLWKHSGMRLWPHAYAGELYQPGRLVYYVETLISMGAFALFALYFGKLGHSIVRHAAASVFVVFVLLIRFLPASENLSPFLTTLGYADSLIAVALMFTICGPAGTRQMLIKASLVFIAINLASLAVPRISMMIGSFSGYARGLTAHRNDLGHISTIALFFLLTAKDSIPQYLRWCGILGGIALVALAGSVQGILLLAGGVAVLAFARHARLLKSPIALFIMAMLVPVIALLWDTVSLDDLLRPFGRDTTFTGRDRIWGLSLYLMHGMPWSGYGIGAVGDSVVSLALLMSFQLGTSFGTAHNSYLEAILSFGWVGGGLFFLAVLVGSVQVFKAYINRGDSANTLPAMIMFFCLVGGITSSEKLFWPAFGWLSFVLAVFLNEHASPKSAVSSQQERPPARV